MYFLKAKAKCLNPLNLYDITLEGLIIGVLTS